LAVVFVAPAQKGKVKLRTTRDRAHAAEPSRLAQ